MPLYEYLCPACGQRFEQIMRFSEADLTPACPYCGSRETRKAISALAAFSGSSDGGAGGCATRGRFT
jgi:putative FmdB family regulatory protein